MPSPGNQSQWTPYTPPPPDGSERIGVAVRRYSFPVLVLLIVVGLGAALYWEFTRDAADAEEARIQAAIEAYQSGGTLAGDDPLGRWSGAGAEGGGTITVRSRPSQATVRVDDDSVGVTPLTGHALAPGVYFVRVEREGYVPVDTLLIVRAEKTPSFTAVLQRGSRATRRTPASRSTSSQRAPPEPSREAANPSSESGGVVSPPQGPPEEPAGDTSPAMGSMQVITEPAEATVLLNGEPRGTTPLTLDALRAGAYRLTLYRSGYDTVRTHVDLAPGAERVVRQSLVPLPGRLRVLVQPWGSVYVDGALRERNTDIWFETTLSAGTHRVTAVHPALGRHTRSIEVAPGGEASVVIDLREASEAADSTENGGGDTSS